MRRVGWGAAAALVLAMVAVGCEGAVDPVPVGGGGADMPDVVPVEGGGGNGDDAEGSGGSDSGPDGSPWPGDEDVEADADSGETVPGGLAACAPELTWQREAGEYDFVYGRQALAIGPGAGLLAVQGAFSRTYHRLADGELLGAEALAAGTLPDRAWSLEAAPLVPADNRVELRDAATGVLIRTLTTAPPVTVGKMELAQLDVAMDPEGTRVAGLACWLEYATGLSESALTVWDAGTGEVIRALVLDEPCDGISWLDRPVLLFAGEHGILVAVLESPRLHRIALPGPETESADLAGDLLPGTPVSGDPPAYVPLLPPILEAVVSPAGDRVAVALHDGSVRVLRLPGLDPLGPVIPGAFAGINLMTYGPSTVAPLAWSPDGSLLAHMAPDGRVGLTLASTAEAVMVLDNPAITSVGAHPGSVNPPAGLTFTPDGEGLVVVHESGAVQWRCDGPGEVPAEDLPVELAGPATVVENETATWAFEHEPLELPAVHGLRDTADGTLFAASLSAALPAALWGPGEHSVVGVVDTGLRRGTTLPLTVQVLNGSW